MAASQWEAVMMAAATQWLPGNGSEAMVARKSMHLKGNGVKVKLVFGIKRKSATMYDLGHATMYGLGTQPHQNDDKWPRQEAQMCNWTAAMQSAGQAMQSDNQTAAYAIGRPAPAMQSDGWPRLCNRMASPAMQSDGQPRLCNWRAGPGYAIGWPAQAMQLDGQPRLCNRWQRPGLCNRTRPCDDVRPGQSPAK